MATGSPADLEQPDGHTPGATTDTGGTGRAVAAPGTDNLPVGAAVTASGRISAAEEFRDHIEMDHPFSSSQLSRLDGALTLAGRQTGLRFGVYIGPLGERPETRVAQLHDALAGSDESVLVAVSPEQRVVEVLTGAGARGRLPDNGARLAVMSMVASFEVGDLCGGLVSGLRMLADQAGARGRRP